MMGRLSSPPRRTRRPPRPPPAPPPPGRGGAATPPSRRFLSSCLARGRDLGLLAGEAVLARGGRVAADLRLALDRRVLGRGDALGGEQRRADRGGGELGKRPGVALQPRQRGLVHGWAPGAGLRERKHRGDEREVVLVAAVGDPRALLEMGLAGGG